MERTLSDVRCFGWGDALYTAYHDEEWGRPVRDERGVYERLCLEGFQSGLSWLTILRKREAFRRGVRGASTPTGSPRFSEDDIERLLADDGDRPPPRQDRGDDRERARDASRCARPASRCTSCSGRMRPPRGRRRVARRLALDDARVGGAREGAPPGGLPFVGPTTLHAAMQACGVVNDHLADCVVRDDVEAVRSSFDLSYPS